MCGEPGRGGPWPSLEGSFLTLTVWVFQGGLVSVLLQTWPRTGLSLKSTVCWATIRAVFHFDTITLRPLLHTPMPAVSAGPAV